MRGRLREYYWAVTTQFGLNPLQTWRGIRALPSFLSDYRRFKASYNGSLELMPFLHDKAERAGDAHSEYFLQDLHVARKIFERNPHRHVDVGSRIDGFVAHVASFRSIEVFDIRPVVDQVDGIVFRRADLMDAKTAPSDYCDSLSCLHALEHFGLGRYGDNVDPLGWAAGLSSLARLLSPGGRLYLSAPVGRERVIFNAHRVFSASGMVGAARDIGLRLSSFSWVAEGKLHTSNDWNDDLDAASERDYSLGIFEFLKD